MAGRRLRCKACGELHDPAEYIKSRPGYCRACRQPASVAKRVAARTKRVRARTNARASYVRRTYGLSPADVAAILAVQGGVCAGCLRRTKDVDHDHGTDEIRGLLCGSCNRRLLPAARNDPAVLRRLADYLENPPARQVGPFYMPSQTAA